jgi:multidrug efflux pump subunit AcrA (membrane-fusion protein)
VAIVISGILPRINARAALDKETAEMAIPTVSVIHPKRGAPAQEVVLPANVQAYIDAPIYARTNGYLKHWYADIGARVKAGHCWRTLRLRKSTSNCGRRERIWQPRKPT